MNGLLAIIRHESGDIFHAVSGDHIKTITIPRCNFEMADYYRKRNEIPPFDLLVFIGDDYRYRGDIMTERGMAREYRKDKE